jgi:UrcA family protein
MPTIIPQRLALAGLAAIGLAAGAVSLPAHAQPGYDETYGPNGDVTVMAPRHMQRDPATGAPIEVVTKSRAVYYGDLDLSAPWGVRTLHARVVRAAVRLCNDLDNQPGPIPEDSNDCVRPAVTNAMYQAPIPDGLRYRESDYGFSY